MRRIYFIACVLTVLCSLLLPDAMTVRAVKPQTGDKKERPSKPSPPAPKPGGKGNGNNNNGKGNSNGKGKGKPGGKGGSSTSKQKEPEPKPLSPRVIESEPEKPRRMITVYEAYDCADTESFSVNGVWFDMALADGGKFEMGCNSYVDEKPVHTVNVKPFYVGRTEVTQELWEAVMGSNPSFYKGKKRPAENMTWYDCQEFISRLNKLTNRQFRLLSETEWEYAARGGRKSHGYLYAGGATIYDNGWYADNSGGTTHEVATKRPNELGIYDMCGNVFEWTSDLYSNTYNYPRNGGASGERRVFRGGGYSNPPIFCRTTYRNNDEPSKRFKDVGLRLAMDANYREKQVPEP